VVKDAFLPRKMLYNFMPGNRSNFKLLWARENLCLARFQRLNRVQTHHCGIALFRCTLTHEVLRNGRSLIKSSERRKCQYVLGPRKRRLEGSTPRGLETLDSAGAFQFAKGERLSVHYRMPNNMRVGSTDTETYFGIFMLW